jgi:transcriptional regulator with XRE-family HTH domain
LTRSVFTDDYRLFLRLLVDGRKRAGLTQAELASALARPQSYVSKFERGERRIDVVEFLDITAALGTDPANLVRRLQRGRTAKTRRV